MDVRRIQMTGGSSFIVTLPKDWILSNGLKKNDPVSITQQSDGSLNVASAGVVKTLRHDSKRICVDGVDDQEFLFRMLLGAYMAGYSTIEVYSDDGLTGMDMDVIERFVRIAIGLEILEGNDSSVTIKDLVDPSEMKLDKSFGRMVFLVRNMLTDTFSAVKTGDKGKFKAVSARDREVDRLEWMITRQTNMSQSDISVAKKMGLDPCETTKLYTLCRIVERIGDHATSLAENCGSMAGSAVFEDMKGEILELGGKIVASFSRSLSMFGSGNISEANDCIEETFGTAELCKRINRYASGMPDDIAISISQIAGSMKRISEYSTDISELAINSMMGE